MKDTVALRELEVQLAGLTRDWSKLGVRLRTLRHDVVVESAPLGLRLHYPAFRGAKPTSREFVDAVANYLTAFCLPRAEIEAGLDGAIDSVDMLAAVEGLRRRAVGLFKQAHALSNRNGEAGELILYLLTEWILGAPQIIAKMSLKTNREMPVHGADGVHIRFEPETGRLLFYSGESKLYQDVGAAIAAAVDSIGTALSDEALTSELELVRRNLDLTGMSATGREALLAYLDPFDEAYNARRDVITCLIGFDFDGYAAVAGGGEAAEAQFCVLAAERLRDLGPRFAAAMARAGLASQWVELFFLPVPSVATLRDNFQDIIGWKRD